MLLRGVGCHACRRRNRVDAHGCVPPGSTAYPPGGPSRPIQVFLRCDGSEPQRFVFPSVHTGDKVTVIWVTDFVEAVCRFAVSLCAMCTCNKAHCPRPVHDTNLC